MNKAYGILSPSQFYLHIGYKTEIMVCNFQFNLVHNKIFDTYLKLNKIITFMNGGNAMLEVVQMSESSSVKLTADNKLSVKFISNSISRILQGEEIELTSNQFKTIKLMSFRDQIQKIKKDYNVFIDIQYNNNLCFISGEDITIAKEELFSRLNKHLNEKYVISNYYSLVGKNLRPFYAEGGKVYYDLQKEFRNAIFQLNVSRVKKSLFIKASNEDYEKIKQRLDLIFQNQAENLKKEECKICQMQIKNGFTLMGCHDEFCRNCLVEYFQSQISDENQVLCPYCDEAVLYCDLLEFFHPNILSKVTENYVLKFVRENKNFMMCPTRNCKQIFNKKTILETNCEPAIFCDSCGEMYYFLHLNSPIMQCVQVFDNKYCEENYNFKQNSYAKKFKICSSCENLTMKKKNDDGVKCECGYIFCSGCGKEFESELKLNKHCSQSICSIIKQSKISKLSYDNIRVIDCRNQKKKNRT